MKNAETASEMSTSRSQPESRRVHALALRWVNRTGCRLLVGSMAVIRRTGYQYSCSAVAEGNGRFWVFAALH